MLADFDMHDDTPMWVANDNEGGGTAIVDVLEVNGYQIILKTAKID